MRVLRTNNAWVALLFLCSLFFIAGQASACHVDLTVTNFISGDHDPDLAFGFTLLDPNGEMVGDEVFLGDGDSAGWGGLRLNSTYILQQTTLPTGWALTDLYSDASDDIATYVLDDLQIELLFGSLTPSNYEFTANFVNAPSNVPVPAAVWLMGSGILALIGVRRKIKL